MRQRKTVEQAAKCLLVLFLFVFIFAENSSALPSNRVIKVLFKKNSGREQAGILLDRSPEISWFSLKNPERIAIDIKDTFLPEISRNDSVTGEIIKNIRISQNTKKVVRAVLDLNSSAYEFRVEQNVIDEKTVLYLTVSQPKTEPVEQQGEIYGNFITPVTDISNSPDMIDSFPTEKDRHDNTEPAQVAVLLDDNFPEGVFEENGTQSPGSGLAFSGSFNARSDFQINRENSVENRTNFRNQILLEAKYKDSMIISALSDYLLFSSENRTDEYDFKIHEVKWRHRNKKINLSLGKQVIRWGKTDQISPVDSLNPEDLRNFILPDYEDRKIPVWMADLRLFMGRFTFEGVVVPYFENSRFDYFQTNWSVFGHMKKEIQNTSLPQSLKTYFNNIRIHEQFPANETEWGLRLTTTFKNVDLGLTFHRTTEDQPYFTNFPMKNININGDFSMDTLIPALDSANLTDQPIEVEYKRTNIVGFEFETTLSDFGIRGEAAWNETESFLTSSLTSVRIPTFTYILGADYTSENNTYLNLQFAHRHITQYDPIILYFDRDTLSLLGEIRIDLISDWFKACIEFTRNITDNSFYLNPYLKYTYITNLECRAGAGIFSGDRDTWFGRYRDHDLFYLNIIYRF